MSRQVRQSGQAHNLEVDNKIDHGLRDLEEGPQAATKLARLSGEGSQNFGGLQGLSGQESQMLRLSAVRLLFQPEHGMHFPQHRKSNAGFSCVSQALALFNTLQIADHPDYGRRSRFRELQEKVEMYERQQNQAPATAGSESDRMRSMNFDNDFSGSDRCQTDEIFVAGDGSDMEMQPRRSNHNVNEDQLQGTLRAPRGRPKTVLRPCSFCNRQFRRAEHLARHERIHTQEKPFTCECGERFSRQDMLLRHSRHAHPQNEYEGHYGNTQELGSASRDQRLYQDAFLFSADQTGHQEVEANNLTIDASVAVPLESHLGASRRDEVVAGPPDFNSQLTFAPHAHKFSWWDSHDDLNTFLPTELFNTDYSLANFDEQGVYQIGTVGLEDASTAGFGDWDLANKPQQLPICEKVSHPEVELNNARSATETSRAYSSLGQELNDTMDTSMILPWRISQPCYEKLCFNMGSVSETLAQGFSLPSRHPLSRYIEGYFRGFDGHLPCIHLHTLSLQTLKPELLLALAAAGALYKFEHDKGYELFHASRAIINRSLHQRAKESSRGNLNPSPTASSDAFADGATQTTQALNILLAMASWGDDHLLPEAFEMAGQLAALVRQIGISESDSLPKEASWTEWAAREERRRTLLVSYILFSLQSIAFNVPPMILNHEVALLLPSRMELWQARTASQWKQARTAADGHGAKFQRVLGELLGGKDIHHSYATSAFSNYLLIHGLIQQIFFERQASSSLISSGPALRGETLKAIEVSLRAWQRAWESTTESTLDPLSPKGPLAFNSTALLRIAYIRLNADLGPHRSLQSRDAGALARSVTGDPAGIMRRSAHVDRAVLQCVHALGILVRAGVSFVARTHTQSWGIVHSLGNIECACLLNCWLRGVADCVRSGGAAALRDDERGLLGMVGGVVAETDLGRDVHLIECDYERIRQLAACTVRLWAEAFSGVHVFQMVRVIAQGLSVAADMLDEYV